MALAEQGRVEEARAYLERALDVNRRNPLLLLLYAQVLRALGEDPKTIREITDELRRLFPRDWRRFEQHLEPVE
jgi:predicted Zn-dependent protease